MYALASSQILFLKAPYIRNINQATTISKNPLVKPDTMQDIKTVSRA